MSAVQPGATTDGNTTGYDANGNRTTSSLTQGGTTSSRTYSLVANTNRPSGFSQTIGTTTTSVTYGYNANGDLTGDGLKGYRYDATGRLVSVAQGSTDTSAVTRYAHNALGQRIFKTEPLYPVQGTTGSALNAFFAKGWTPSTVSAEQVGWAYGYDEDGTLLGEYGMGGAQSAGNKVYVYLPTPSGPLPVVVMGDTTRWAIAADHLNTPRRLTRIDGALEWQWSLSGFGQEEPTIAAKKFLPNAPTTTSDFSFNLRFPGQTQDRESGLAYNYFRSYNPTTGRYTQPDPIGLDGGWNQFSYVSGNPLLYVDPEGLFELFRGGGVTVDAYPGPQAGGKEHARRGPGENYHIHIRDSQGREARISTETWKPLTPGDKEIFDSSKQMQRACNDFTDGQKKFFDRVNREVFHRGVPTGNQLMRLIQMRIGGRGGVRGSE